MTEGGDASTPLDPNEATGLRLAYVSTRAELNEAEALNIEAGLRWSGRRRSLDEVLDSSFLRELHRRMFGDVWGWAGSYRRTEKNLGIDWWHIPVAVDELVRDAAVWCTAGPSGWSIDEIGARFHHRLVSIHPFPNGNGRMSRAAADLVVAALGAAPFTWGRQSAREPGAARSRYPSPKVRRPAFGGSPSSPSRLCQKASDLLDITPGGGAFSTSRNICGPRMSSNSWASSQVPSSITLTTSRGRPVATTMSGLVHQT